MSSMNGHGTSSSGVTLLSSSISLLVRTVQASDSNSTHTLHPIQLSYDATPIYPHRFGRLTWSAASANRADSVKSSALSSLRVIGLGAIAAIQIGHSSSEEEEPPEDIPPTRCISIEARSHTPGEGTTRHDFVLASSTETKKLMASLQQLLEQRAHRQLITTAALAAQETEVPSNTLAMIEGGLEVILHSRATPFPNSTPTLLWFNFQKMFIYWRPTKQFNEDGELKAISPSEIYVEDDTNGLGLDQLSDVFVGTHDAIWQELVKKGRMKAMAGDDVTMTVVGMQQDNPNEDGFPTEVQLHIQTTKPSFQQLILDGIQYANDWSESGSLDEIRAQVIVQVSPECRAIAPDFYASNGSISSGVASEDKPAAATTTKSNASSTSTKPTSAPATVSAPTPTPAPAAPVSVSAPAPESHPSHPQFSDPDLSSDPTMTCLVGDGLPVTIFQLESSSDPFSDLLIYEARLQYVYDPATKLARLAWSSTDYSGFILFADMTDVFLSKEDDIFLNPLCESYDPDSCLSIHAVSAEMNGVAFGEYKLHITTTEPSERTVFLDALQHGLGQMGGAVEENVIQEQEPIVEPEPEPVVVAPIVAAPVVPPSPRTASKLRAPSMELSAKAAEAVAVVKSLSNKKKSTPTTRAAAAVAPTTTKPSPTKRISSTTAASTPAAAPSPASSRSSSLKKSSLPTSSSTSSKPPSTTSSRLSSPKSSRPSTAAPVSPTSAVSTPASTARSTSKMISLSTPKKKVDLVEEERKAKEAELAASKMKILKAAAAEKARRAAIAAGTAPPPSASTTRPPLKTKPTSISTTSSTDATKDSSAPASPRVGLARTTSRIATRSPSPASVVAKPTRSTTTSATSSVRSPSPATKPTRTSIPASSPTSARSSSRSASPAPVRPVKPAVPASSPTSARSSITPAAATTGTGTMSRTTGRVSSASAATPMKSRLASTPTASPPATITLARKSAVPSTAFGSKLSVTKPKPATETSPSSTPTRKPGLPTAATPKRKLVVTPQPLPTAATTTASAAPSSRRTSTESASAAPLPRKASVPTSSSSSTTLKAPVPERKRMTITRSPNATPKRTLAPSASPMPISSPAQILSSPPPNQMDASPALARYEENDGVMDDSLQEEGLLDEQAVTVPGDLSARPYDPELDQELDFSLDLSNSTPAVKALPELEVTAKSALLADEPIVDYEPQIEPEEEVVESQPKEVEEEMAVEPVLEEQITVTLSPIKSATPPPTSVPATPEHVTEVVEIEKAVATEEEEKEETVTQEAEEQVPAEEEVVVAEEKVEPPQQQAVTSSPSEPDFIETPLPAVVAETPPKASPVASKIVSKPVAEKKPRMTMFGEELDDDAPEEDDDLDDLFGTNDDEEQEEQPEPQPEIEPAHEPVAEVEQHQSVEQVKQDNKVVIEPQPEPIIVSEPSVPTVVAPISSKPEILPEVKAEAEIPASEEYEEVEAEVEVEEEAQEEEVEHVVEEQAEEEVVHEEVEEEEEQVVEEEVVEEEEEVEEEVVEEEEEVAAAPVPPIILPVIITPPTNFVPLPIESFATMNIDSKPSSGSTTPVASPAAEVGPSRKVIRRGASIGGVDEMVDVIEMPPPVTHVASLSPKERSSVIGAQIPPKATRASFSHKKSIPTGPFSTVGGASSRKASEALAALVAAMNTPPASTPTSSGNSPALTPRGKSDSNTQPPSPGTTVPPKPSLLAAPIPAALIAPGKQRVLTPYQRALQRLQDGCAFTSWTEGKNGTLQSAGIFLWFNPHPSPLPGATEPSSGALFWCNRAPKGSVQPRWELNQRRIEVMTLSDIFCGRQHGLLTRDEFSSYDDKVCVTMISTDSEPTRSVTLNLISESEPELTQFMEAFNVILAGPTEEDLATEADLAANKVPRVSVPFLSDSLITSCKLLKPIHISSSPTEPHTTKLSQIADFWEQRKQSENVPIGQYALARLQAGLSVQIFERATVSGDVIQTRSYLSWAPALPSYDTNGKPQADAPTEIGSIRINSFDDTSSSSFAPSSVTNKLTRTIEPLEITELVLGKFGGLFESSSSNRITDYADHARCISIIYQSGDSLNLEFDSIRQMLLWVVSLKYLLLHVAKPLEFQLLPPITSQPPPAFDSFAASLRAQTDASLVATKFQDRSMVESGIDAASLRSLTNGIEFTAFTEGDSNRIQSTRIHLLYSFESAEKDGPYGSFYWNAGSITSGGTFVKSIHRRIELGHIRHVQQGLSSFFFQRHQREVGELEACFTLITNDDLLHLSTTSQPFNHLLESLQTLLSWCGRSVIQEEPAWFHVTGGVEEDEEIPQPPSSPKGPKSNGLMSTQAALAKCVTPPPQIPEPIQTFVPPTITPEYEKHYALLAKGRSFYYYYQSPNSDTVSRKSVQVFFSNVVPTTPSFNLASYDLPVGEDKFPALWMVEYPSGLMPPTKLSPKDMIPANCLSLHELRDIFLSNTSPIFHHPSTVAQFPSIKDEACLSIVATGTPARNNVTDEWHLESVKSEGLDEWMAALNTMLPLHLDEHEQQQLPVHVPIDNSSTTVTDVPIASVPQPTLQPGQTFVPPTLTPEYEQSFQLLSKGRPFYYYYYTPDGSSPNATVSRKSVQIFFSNVIPTTPNFTLQSYDLPLGEDHFPSLWMVAYPTGLMPPTKLSPKDMIPQNCLSLHELRDIFLSNTKPIFHHPSTAAQFPSIKDEACLSIVATGTPARNNVTDEWHLESLKSEGIMEWIHALNNMLPLHLDEHEQQQLPVHVQTSSVEGDSSITTEEVTESKKMEPALPSESAKSSVSPLPAASTSSSVSTNLLRTGADFLLFRPREISDAKVDYRAQVKLFFLTADELTALGVSTLDAEAYPVDCQPYPDEPFVGAFYFRELSTVVPNAPLTRSDLKSTQCMPLHSLSDVFHGQEIHVWKSITEQFLEEDCFTLISETQEWNLTSLSTGTELVPNFLDAIEKILHPEEVNEETGATAAVTPAVVPTVASEPVVADSIQEKEATIPPAETTSSLPLSPPGSPTSAPLLHPDMSIEAILAIMGEQKYATDQKLHLTGITLLHAAAAALEQSSLPEGEHASNLGANGLAVEGLTNLIDSGVAKQVIESMNLFLRNEQLQAIGCGILWICSVNSENELKLTSLGAISAILNALQNHVSSVTVAQQAAGALRNCAASPSNAETIGNSQGLETLITVMKTHITNSSIIHQSLGAIASVCLNSSNKTQLASLGGIELIISLLKRFDSDQGVHEEGCACLRNLGANHPNNKTLIASCGGFEIVLQSMKTFRANPLNQLHACGMFWNNTANNAANKLLLAQIGGVDSILETLSIHKTDQEIVGECVGTLRNLSSVPETQTMLFEKGVLDVIIECMNLYPEIQLIQEQCCAFLFNMSDSDSCAEKIIALNAVPALLQAIELYMAHKSVVEEACGCLWMLTRAPGVFQTAAPPTVIELADQIMGVHSHEPSVLKFAQGMKSAWSIGSKALSPKKLNGVPSTSA